MTANTRDIGIWKVSNICFSLSVLPDTDARILICLVYHMSRSLRSPWNVVILRNPQSEAIVLELMPGMSTDCHIYTIFSTGSFHSTWLHSACAIYAEHSGQLRLLFNNLALLSSTLANVIFVLDSPSSPFRYSAKHDRLLCVDGWRFRSSHP